MTQPVKSKIMLILINSNSERLSIQIYVYSFIFHEETLKIQHSHFCLQENQYIRQRSAKCRIKYLAQGNYFTCIIHVKKEFLLKSFEEFHCNGSKKSQ